MGTGERTMTGMAYRVVNIGCGPPDDGAGLPAQPADGVGLTNVRQRLALLGGPDAALALEPRAEGGCIARLTLPAPNP